MGLFSNKKVENTSPAVAEQKDKTSEIKSRMKAIKEIGRFSIEQKEKLQSEESNTINGIETIRESFSVVEDKYTNISDY